MTIVVLCAGKWFIGDCDNPPVEKEGRWSIRLKNVREVICPMNIAANPRGEIRVDRMTLLGPVCYTNKALPELNIWADAWFDTEGVEKETLDRIMREASNFETRGRASDAGLIIPDINVRRNES